jgi:putative tryptophan/tyrosine transport system substrate-binding protein
MNRRAFITLLSAALASWPFPAGAQQDARVRRIGVLIDIAEGDPEGMLRIAALRRGLQELGWSEGRNIRIDVRWNSGKERRQEFAAELVGLKPDVIFAGNTSALVALRQVTSTLPIVFVQVDDPVAGGFVASLARPGGNTTGFALYEFGIAAKWVELLRELAPHTARMGVLYDTANLGRGHVPAVQSALSPGMQLLPYPVGSRADIEEAIEKIGGEGHSALIVMGGPQTAAHRDLIVLTAVKRGLPTAFPYKYFATAGGLLSYGPDTIDQYRVAAGYVDRILKGEKPADLPVQFPNRYNLVINLKTANALGLAVPPTLLARADEVIE